MKSFAVLNLGRTVLKTILLLLLCPLMATGAQAREGRADRGVRLTLQTQCDAWNNGDLEQFLKGYMHSDQTSFVSGGTEVKGYDALRDRYLKKYGSSRQTMGKLSFSNLEVEELGRNNALCIGHWLVERSDKSTIGGIFSLVFVRTKSGWKIRHDHTSVADGKA